MTSTIYFLVGVPAVGKSTIAEKLSDRVTYVPHDDYQDGGYIDAILAAAAKSTKPVLVETPFSVSRLLGPLTGGGRNVVPVFILEPERKLRERWHERGNVSESAQRGHLTRQETFRQRAHELGAFAGTAEEVLSHLRSVA